MRNLLKIILSIALGLGVCLLAGVVFKFFYIPIGVEIYGLKQITWLQSVLIIIALNYLSDLFKRLPSGKEKEVSCEEIILTKLVRVFSILIFWGIGAIWIALFL